MEILKFILFSGTLIYISISDIKTRNIPKVIYPILMMIGLINISLSSFLGLVSFLPLYFIGLIFDGLGGADMKLAGLLGFILKDENGLFALFIGLLLGIIIVPITHKLQGKKINSPFALVPYLSVGCIFTNLILIL